MRREYWERFPHHRGLAIRTYITARGGENVPGTPCACTTRNFTYLLRGPYYDIVIAIFFSWKAVINWVTPWLECVDIMHFQFKMSMDFVDMIDGYILPEIINRD